RKVAVKRVHADSPEEMARRLQREARLGASLNHRGLVSVFDTATYEEGVLIVMEYVDGETLAEALKRGPLPAARALEIVRDLAAALDHVHAQGIVHRDVKPANILLGTDGSVKLVDLGIGMAAGHTRITQSGVVLGTPAYMAPEQVDGTEVTSAADVYALGAVAFELLSGRKARTGNGPIDIAHKAATEPPPDLREAWPDAPRQAADVLKRAMARDPRRRQASAGELADELGAALEREATASTRFLAAPPPPVVAARSRRRLLPLAAVVVGLALVGIAIALITSSGGGSGAPKQASTHHHRTHHAKKKTHTQTQAAQTTSTPAATPSPGTSTPPTQGPIGLNNQGKSLIDSGHPQQAIPFLQKALAAFPADQRSSINYAYTLFNLGDAYLKSGQPDKAIPYLRQRLNWPDQRSTVLAELQQAMQQAGQSGGAPAPGPGKGPEKHGHGPKDG
ncbi:MAG TPA: serine/threonine-protein kinase, partial [Thermoleophilaceae bacterium]|nr:serine/threonine-protein kinase [Thermoleophilaceae bacterium]